MEILYIVLFLVLVLGTVYYKKMTKENTQNSLKKLSKYFKGSNFSNIETVESLKESLQIKESKNYTKAIEIIVDDAKHKFDILSEYRVKHKQGFNKFTLIKVVSNCVIDYSLKKDFDLNKSICLLLITLESQKLKDTTQEQRDDEDILEDFSSLIEGFITRYKQRKDN